MLPPHPPADDLRRFAHYHALHALSNREYHAWVKSEAEQGQAWAREMLASVQAVAACLDFWSTHMDIMSKHESDHGLTVLCRALPTAMPIPRDGTPVVVADCCLTAHKQRPCYEIASVKNTFPPVYVHQTLLQTVQSLWAVRHWAQVSCVAICCVGGLYSVAKDRNPCYLVYFCRSLLPKVQRGQGSKSTLSG